MAHPLPAFADPALAAYAQDLRDSRPEADVTEKALLDQLAVALWRSRALAATATAAELNDDRWVRRALALDRAVSRALQDYLRAGRGQRDRDRDRDARRKRRPPSLYDMPPLRAPRAPAPRKRDDTALAAAIANARAESDLRLAELERADAEVPEVAPAPAPAALAAPAAPAPDVAPAATAATFTPAGPVSGKLAYNFGAPVTNPRELDNIWRRVAATHGPAEADRAVAAARAGTVYSPRSGP